MLSKEMSTIFFTGEEFCTVLCHSYIIALGWSTFAAQ